MRRIRATCSRLVIVGFAVAAAIPGAAAASPFTPLGQVESSATNVYAGCPPDASGVNFPNSEVEPWLEVNPTDADNLATFYQQDRYSNGGAKSNAAGVELQRRRHLDAGLGPAEHALHRRRASTSGRRTRGSASRPTACCIR